MRRQISDHVRLQHRELQAVPLRSRRAHVPRKTQAHPAIPTRGALPTLRCLRASPWEPRSSQPGRHRSNRSSGRPDKGQQGRNPQHLFPVHFKRRNDNGDTRRSGRLLKTGTGQGEDLFTDPHHAQHPLAASLRFGRKTASELALSPFQRQFRHRRINNLHRLNPSTRYAPRFTPLLRSKNRESSYLSESRDHRLQNPRGPHVYCRPHPRRPPNSYVRCAATERLFTVAGSSADGNRFPGLHVAGL